MEDLTIIAEQPHSDERLAKLWETPPNFLAWLSTVDHKKLGIRYINTAFLFFLLGGLEAVLMRLQLSRPENHLLSPEAYNQLFTMHGTTMMFLFIQPVLSGFSFYLVPLMIGARELAFPRLNTFSYYVFLFAGIFLYSSFFVGQAPNGGWFNYVPLTDTNYNPGLNIDFYALGLLFLGISTMAGSINLIVSILRLRAPGMSIDRMPLLMWSSLTTSFAVVFALPALTVALLFLELERKWHLVFFDQVNGGSPLLWQHLFWIFGHPWVYIVFLPATGMLSMIIPTFCRRPMIGHNFVALATVATGIAGFGVWVHHMFTTGLPQISTSFFSAASMTVSIPSAIQIFAWIATIWYGRVVFKTPMLFAFAFIVQFLIGGISGVMAAAIPFDWQAQDTYFIVAHLHYVLAGSSLFGLFAAVYYWFPKMTGRMTRPSLDKASFWTMVVGFNLAFFPMHIAGLLGMPRRVYTFPAGAGLELPNLLSTIGGAIFAIGVAITLWNLFVSRRSGAEAGPNPWDAASLEWNAASPPEDYNFERIPIVSGREPIWTGAVSDGPRFDEGRLTPRTSVLAAELEKAIELPEGDLWTIVISLSLLLFFAAMLMLWYTLAIVMGLVSLISLARWMWPVHRKILETEA